MLITNLWSLPFIYSQRFYQYYYLNYHLKGTLFPGCLFVNLAFLNDLSLTIPSKSIWPQENYITGTSTVPAVIHTTTPVAKNTGVSTDNRLVNVQIIVQSDSHQVMVEKYELQFVSEGSAPFKVKFRFQCIYIMGLECKINKN